MRDGKILTAGVRTASSIARNPGMIHEQSPRSGWRGYACMHLHSLRLRQGLVGSVAERRIGRLFALAPPHGFFLGHLEFYRLQASSLVGSVAKRLVRGTPAGTPPMGAGLDFKGQRLAIANDRFFGHDGQPTCGPASLRDGNRKNSARSGCRNFNGRMLGNRQGRRRISGFLRPLRRHTIHECHRKPAKKEER